MRKSSKKKKKMMQKLFSTKKKIIHSFLLYKTAQLREAVLKKSKVTWRKARSY